MMMRKMRIKKKLRIKIWLDAIVLRVKKKMMMRMMIIQKIVKKKKLCPIRKLSRLMT